MHARVLYANLCLGKSFTKCTGIPDELGVSEALSCVLCRYALRIVDMLPMKLRNQLVNVNAGLERNNYLNVYDVP